MDLLSFMAAYRDLSTLGLRALQRSLELGRICSAIMHDHSSDSNGTNISNLQLLIIGQFPQHNLLLQLWDEETTMLMERLRCP